MCGPSTPLSRPAIRRPLAVFRHRAFLIFWLGACVSNMGNWTENAAQSWAVKRPDNPFQKGKSDYNPGRRSPQVGGDGEAGAERAGQRLQGN